METYTHFHRDQDSPLKISAGPEALTIPPKFYLLHKSGSNLFTGALNRQIFPSGWRFRLIQVKQSRCILESRVKLRRRVRRVESSCVMLSRDGWGMVLAHSVHSLEAGRQLVWLFFLPHSFCWGWCYRSHSLPPCLLGFLSSFYPCPSLTQASHLHFLTPPPPSSF